MSSRHVGVAVSVALVFMSASAAWLLSAAMPVATGFLSKYICSSVFVSGRDERVVFHEDVAPVHPLFRLVSFRVDRQAKAVVAGAFGVFEARAVFREGCGCTLVRDATETELHHQPIASAPTRENTPDDLGWPDVPPGSSHPLPPDIDPEKLNRAIDNAFSEMDPRKPSKRTRAVLVAYRGMIIAERYAPGFHHRMPLLGWSMNKSVTNALVGILVKQGRLDITAPAPVPEWKTPGDPRAVITLDQLLRMSSGLEFSEVYLPLFDATRMLYESGDFAAYAAQKPPAASPDARFSYSSGTANIISRIVRRTIEKDRRNYYDFLRNELFDKIGMYSTVMEADPSGTFVGSSYALATPRDWARFGLLYLQDGTWQGERILPEGWVAYTTTPTPKAPQGRYGAMFWLNAGSPSHPSDRRWPSLPPDAYSAEGFMEQRLIIIPSRELVLVRFGATADRNAWNTEAFIADVLAAFSESKGV